MKKIIVTGGAGYIGSHIVKLLRDESDAEIHVVDNFSQTRKNVLIHPRITYHEVDICNKLGLHKVFSETQPDIVFHLAAHANVPESVINPSHYYENNVVGSLNLLEVMRECGTNQIVFSSAAAIYGEPVTEEIDEDHQKVPTNAYGRTKLIFEDILADYYRAYGIASISFRYFCAAGADPEGEVAEYQDPQTHVLPSIIETVLGKREVFSVFGNDYPTFDGTGVRDYIHVVDVARAHIQAMKHLESNVVCVQYNLGIQKGFSVLELIKTVEKVSGKKVPHDFRPRRLGDPSRLIARSERAQRELGWKPEYTDIEAIVSTAYDSFKDRP